jgi:hypothetical protein
MQVFRLSHRKEIIVLFLLVFLIIFNVPSNFSVFADSMNPYIYSKDSSPHNIPYAQWLSKWWQWSMAVPSEQHPRENNDPVNCGINQSGPVWFLADNLKDKQERTCTIPAGKSILVPLLTGNCHNDGIPEPMDDQELLACALAGNEYGAISATLDGRTLNNLQQYRTQSPFYNITVPENNIYENKPGKFRGIVDGFFIFLEPLPEGKHDLVLKTNVKNPSVKDYNYASEILLHDIGHPGLW